MTILIARPFTRRILSGAIGLLALLGSFPTLGSENQLNQAANIQIVVTKESISTGSTVLCSAGDFEESLAGYSKDTHVLVDNDPDVPTETLIRINEILRSLGFEDVSSNSAGDPGWALYPLPSDTDLFTCEKSSLEDTGEVENDS